MTNPVAPEVPQEPNAAPNYAAPNYASMPPTQQAPKAKSFSWVRILIPIGIIVVLAVGGVVWKHVSGDPDVAKVGNCLSGQSENDIKVVDCNGGTADWKVVGKVDNQSKPVTDADSEKACAPWPNFEASFWKGKEGGKGYILCLAPTK